MTKVGWYAVDKSTTLESNKSLCQNALFPDCLTVDKTNIHM
jgi:hypothetical protein